MMTQMSQYCIMNIYKAQNDDTNVTIRQQGHFSLFVSIVCIDKVSVIMCIF